MQFLSDIMQMLKTGLLRLIQLVFDALRQLVRALVGLFMFVIRLTRLNRLGLALLATGPGQALVARIAHARSIYAKLTSPPPDPMVAAMMLQAEQVDIDEDPTEVHGNKLFVLIAGFFVLAILWAALTELDEVVRADGQIVPPSSVQLVQNRLPGSVLEINARFGDRVEKGDIIFRLEDEEVRANFDDNEITRLASFATTIRLEAEATGAQTLEFPSWLVAADKEVVARERDVFDRRKLALKNRLQVIRQQVRENRAMANNLAERIAIYTPLVEAGYEARLTLVDLQGRFEQSSLAADRAENEYAATLTNFRAEAARELAQKKTEANQADARELAFKAKVRHADVRAPVAGIVSAVHIKTVGAVVQAGTVMAEIVPDEQALLVEVRIKPEDIASVYPGQIAQVSLSAYDVARYGNLDGKVQRVASNTTQQENMPPYYQTMVEIPEPRLSKSEDDVEVVPGMTVMVDIIGKKRTVLNYILTPLNRAAGVAFREN